MAVFSVCLALPTIALLLGYDAALASSERRSLSRFPGWPTTAEALRRFPDGCESYVNDNFGLRSELVTLNSWVLLKIGVSGTSRVIVGRDGWLFLATKALMDDYRALEPPQPSLVERWFDDMNRRLEFLTRHGIDMLVVVVPDKQTIYPEYMPKHVTRSGRPGALDTILALAPSRAPDLEILDLRSALLAHKPEHRLYAKTDSHWNTLGAFFGYEAIAHHLCRRFPTVKPLLLTDYHLKERVTRGLGLARMLGLTNQLSEHGYTLEKKFPSRVVERTRLDDYDPVATELVTTSLVDAPSVFIIGDSFLEMPQPFLEETFRRLLTTDRRGRGFDQELILSFAPDVLIYETVARNLFQETARD